MLFIRQLLFTQLSIGVAKTFAITILTTFPTTATINQPSYASDIKFLGIRLTDAPKVATLTAEDFFNQGLDKLKKGDLQGVIAAYTEAIRLNPNFALAYTNRGLARPDLGDNKRAMEDFNQALRINPNYALKGSQAGKVQSEKRFGN